MSANPPQSGQPMATVDRLVLGCGLKLKVVLWRKISSQCGTVVVARYNCDGCGGYFADSPKSIQYFCHSISPTLWDSDERFQFFREMWITEIRERCIIPNLRRPPHFHIERQRKVVLFNWWVTFIFVSLNSPHSCLGVIVSLFCSWTLYFYRLNLHVS